MSEQPYHKYVFDSKNRKFIGKFEEMYKQEDKENFDSWHQEDLNDIITKISFSILNTYTFKSILDIGCGKGKFTSLLKSKNNKVKGIDISLTAIKKAKERYPNISFECMDIKKDFNNLKEKFELIIMKEILSYLENWRDIIKYVFFITEKIFITLYLPENPIGFIKNFNELKNEIEKYAFIENEILINNNCIIILAKKNDKNSK